MTIATRATIATLLLTFSTLAGRGIAATAPSAGQATGTLAVNGSRLELKHAIAVTGPDPIDKTQEAIMVFITADPIPRPAIESATSFFDVRNALERGIAYRFRMGAGFNVTLRHPVLAEQALQASGSGRALKDIVVGPDVVSGSISSSMMGGDEEIMSFVVAYSTRFTAPIARRFPLEKPMVLTPMAKKLPAGGGGPGKAFIDEKCKPAPTDAKGVEASLKEAGLLPTDKDLEEMSKSAGHPVTRQEFIAQMVQIAKRTAPFATTRCKVLGGKVEGDIALLQVEATTMGVRNRSEVIMAKDGPKWTVKKEGSWSAVK